MKLYTFLLVGLIIYSNNSFAKELQIPLKLENHFIEQVIKAQIFTGKKSTLRVNDDGSGCHFTELANPKVSTSKRSLKVRVKARVKIGQPVGNRQCFFLVNWNGYLDLYHDVKISPGGKNIRIVVRKSEVLTSQGKKDELGDAVWQSFRSQLFPKLNALNIDLNEPINNIKQIIPLVVAKNKADLIQQSIQSIRVRDVRLLASAVSVNIVANLPPLVPVAPVPVKQFTPVELELLEKKLDAIDAFITFSIKQFLKPSLPEQQKTVLFNILFDARYKIVEILSDPDNAGKNPVRKLFISTWKSLSPLIQDIASRYEDQALALHILSFVTANDALTSIDLVGPELGLEISIEGLHRLARMLNDDPNIDPIQRDEKVDPVLRQMFGLQKSIQDVQGEIAPDWIDYFITRAKADKAISIPRNVEKKLNNWVPRKHEMNRYLPMVKTVLTVVAHAQLKKKKLNKRFQKLYKNLVYAAAWQESCWKQFSNIKGFRRPLRSYSGDLGLMQINPRVWRGFYNLHKIKWDIVYNANAGAEILIHYLTKYVLKNKEHIKTGKIENLARATYSGYNGGPRQYTRYRKQKISGKLKRIDRAFYKKYKAIRDKGVMSVKQCYPGI